MTTTFVYAIHNPNKREVKIGYSSDPLRRITQLQGANTDRLDLLSTFAGGILEEQDLHELLKKHRLTGEWFKYNNAVLNILSEFSRKHHPEPPDFEGLALREFLDEYCEGVLSNTKTKKRTRVYFKDIKVACQHLVDTTPQAIKDAMEQLDYEEKTDASRIVFFEKTKENN